MIGTLLLALSLTAADVQQHPPGSTVWGQVRSEKTGAPLQLAVVEVLGHGSLVVLSAPTDSNGIYVLHGIAQGRQRVRATHIDHAPFEVEILVAGERQIHDFDLELRPMRLPTVNARVPRPSTALLDTIAITSPELSAAAARALESSPGMAELGLAEAAREVPGYEPVDPSDILFVRGSAADLKLVLLNGAPVYAPFHIGGLIQALDADVLRAATLYLGGAPARYDGGLSYVMDLETRSGRRSGMHGSMGVDLLASHAALEGPIGARVSYIASGRAVHGVGTEPFFTEEFPYGYRDGLARVDVALGDSAALSASGFWNRESVRLDELPNFEQDAEWGNDAGSLRYSGTVRGVGVELTAASGRFRTGLPLGGLRPLMTEGISQRSRYNADFERPLGPARVFFGFSHDDLTFEYRALSRGPGPDSVLLGSRARGAIAGGYIDGTWYVHERLRLRGGVRADRFSLDPELRIAPRLAATLLLTDHASLGLAGGRYRQYVRAPGRGLVFLGAPVPDSSSEPPMQIAEATHLVLSLTQDLGEGVRLGLEGYYKNFDGLPSTESGNAESSGVDLWLRRSAGTLRGWLSYSLGWVWSTPETRPRPLQSFAGRHLVSVGLAGPVLGGGMFDVRVSYGAGLPYTAIPEPERASPVFARQLRYNDGPATPSVPSDPDQPYLRVDAELQRTWRARVNDFEFDLTPYVKVLNALNRRDALFYHFDRDVGAAEPLAGLPLLPLVGLQWTF